MIIINFVDGGEELREVSVNCSYVVQKLQPFTNYTFFVRAYNSKSASDYSKGTRCQTGEGGKSVIEFISIHFNFEILLHGS